MKIFKLTCKSILIVLLSCLSGCAKFSDDDDDDEEEVDKLFRFIEEWEYTTEYQEALWEASGRNEGRYVSIVGERIDKINASVPTQGEGCTLETYNDELNGKACGLVSAFKMLSINNKEYIQGEAMKRACDWYAKTGIDDPKIIAALGSVIKGFEDKLPMLLKHVGFTPIMFQRRFPKDFKVVAASNKDDMATKLIEGMKDGKSYMLLTYEPSGTMHYRTWVKGANEGKYVQMETDGTMLEFSEADFRSHIEDRMDSNNINQMIEDLKNKTTTDKNIKFMQDIVKGIAPDKLQTTINALKGLVPEFVGGTFCAITSVDSNDEDDEDDKGEGEK